MAISVVSVIGVAGSSSGAGQIGASFQTPTTGDLEIVAYMCGLAGGEGFVPDPADNWTMEVDVETNRLMRLYWRIAQSATKSGVFTFDPSGEISVQLYTHALIRGYDPVDPIDVSGTADSGGVDSSTITSPSLTPATPGLYYSLFLGATGGTATTSITIPGSMTGSSTWSSTNAYAGRLGWEQLSSNGATGTRSATLANGDTSRNTYGIACVVRPAPVSQPGFFPFFS